MSDARVCGERGATLVEFALVLPILAMLLFGVADLSLVLIGNSVGTNAAREGARVAILHHEGADEPGSANHQAIVAAVNDRVAGLVRGGAVDAVRVRCYNGGAPTPEPLRCSVVDVTRGDLIEVEVEWQHLGASPFVSNLTHVDRSRMVILGGTDPELPPPPAIVPLLTIEDVRVVEGDEGTTEAAFAVRRSPATGLVSVRYATADGAALAGEDYRETVGTIEMADGVVDGTITVPVLGDTDVEGDSDVEVGPGTTRVETFEVRLSMPVGGRLDDASGLGTIEDDDVPPEPAPPGQP